MNINKLKKLLPDYIENNLQPDEFQQVKKALESSQELKAEYDAFKKTWELLGDYEEIEPDPDFVSQFWTKASMQKPWYEEWFYNLRFGFKQNKMAAVMITMCLMVVVTTFTYNSFRIEPAFEVQIVQEDIQMIEYLELAENYEVISDIDLLEDLELFEGIDPMSLIEKESVGTAV